MEISWQKIRLQLKETFSISYGDYSFREALIINISYLGQIGHGECTAIDYYNIDIDKLILKLNSNKALIEKSKIIHPSEFYTFLLSLKLTPFLTSALDCAYWDLYGKLENKNFLELNNIEAKNIPESSITISVGNIEDQIKKIENSDWNKFKVKCKGLQVDNVIRLSKINRSIALDSNASFTEKDCQWLENQEFVSKFSYIEQPMPIMHYTQLLRNKFANWMADEDCQNHINLRSLQPHYKSINIKLVKCGGLTPSLEMIKLARQMGFKIMIGCMTESTVGISAGAVLSPLADYADLDGANLVLNDIAQGSQIIKGKIEISDQPGLGIKLI